MPGGTTPGGSTTQASTPGGNTPGNTTPGGNTPGGNTPTGSGSTPTSGGTLPGGSTPTSNGPGGNTSRSPSSSSTTTPGINEGSGVAPHQLTTTPSGAQPSYTYPPGLVPYGQAPTTMASMLAWREPDGTPGSGSTMLHHALSGPQQETVGTEDAFQITTETTHGTTTSATVDPRWQRIRPVYIW
ncbi:hypothetical protein F4780DRAFT_778867 [Xylariomycetidae sp. FL0641]|nr:hypothetical protein F4780DRAFT_778867 [Xylariomycetidae sp. FL0641]